ncbi:MAG: hypothetical protein PF961_03635 [Planctomycetota bacterium]|jgi:hypothetical protein|nr:hypothetical protein [Planctomycetota bacterium]
MFARRIALFVTLLALALCAAGCSSVGGREELSPYRGYDHNARYVGQVDQIPMNGR